jgi:ammonia channel protein AmtB
MILHEPLQWSIPIALPFCVLAWLQIRRGNWKFWAASALLLLATGVGLIWLGFFGSNDGSDGQWKIGAIIFGIPLALAGLLTFAFGAISLTVIKFRSEKEH